MQIPKLSFWPWIGIVLILGLLINGAIAIIVASRAKTATGPDGQRILTL